MALKGYWPLRANSNDAVGSNNGSDTNVSYVAGGPKGAYASFSGSGKSVIANNSAFEPSTSGTASALFYRASGTATNQTVFGINNVINADTYGYSLWYEYTGNNVCFEFDNSASFNQKFVSASRDVWHFVEHAWDASNLYRYMDGVLVETVAKPYAIAYNTQPLTIGGDNTNGTRGLIGGVANASIRDDAQTAAGHKNGWAFIKGLI